MMNLFSKRINRDVFFVAVVVLISLLYDYQNILLYRPQGIHVWRQTDCLSLTYNYYKESTPFLEPEVHIQFSDTETSGKTLGEFPVLYYFIGNLWKIFGHQEFIYRLVVLLFSYLGLYSLYRIAWKLTGSWFLACSAAVLLFTSPVYAFYSANFLTNIPAFSCMLMGWYCLSGYFETGRQRSFNMAMLLFLFTGLLKVSTLMSFLLLPLALLLEQTGFFRPVRNRILFNRPVLQGVMMFGLLACVMNWYVYADHFMQLHEGRYTFTRPVPVWSVAKDQLDVYFLHFKESLIHQIHRIGTLVLLILAAIFLGIRSRKVERFWLIGMPVLVVGYVLFVLLFIYSLDGHDYYHIDFLAPLMFIYLAFIRYLSREEKSLLSSPVFMSIYSVFLVFNVMGCANNLHVRYHNCPNSELAYRQIFCSRKEIDLLGYPQWQSDIMKTYGTVQPELRRLGVKREDLFLSMDDGSFNTTLYLMDQKGWPNIEGALADSSKIAQKIGLGAGFLILHRPETLEQEWLQPFLKYPFLVYENLQVFDLRPLR